MVKKVLTHDRRTIKIRFGLPNPASIRTPGYLAPRMCQYANLPVEGRPEVYFRIVHIAQDSQHGGPAEVCCDQAVEITFDPKGEGGTNTASIVLIILQESFR